MAKGRTGQKKKRAAKPKKIVEQTEINEVPYTSVETTDGLGKKGVFVREVDAVADNAETFVENMGGMGEHWADGISDRMAERYDTDPSYNETPKSNIVLWFIALGVLVAIIAYIGYQLAS